MQTYNKDSRGWCGIHQCWFAFYAAGKRITRNFITDITDICSNVAVLFICRRSTCSKMFLQMHICICLNKEGSVSVCVCGNIVRACITWERIRQPHFQFRSISARISVIPLKSRSSPTVTSYNGANTIEWWAPSYAYKVPFGARSQSPNLSVCKQTPLPSSSTENTDLAAFYWALCRHI